MLKDVSSVIESSVLNSNKIKIEAADVSVYINVPSEKPGDQNSDGAVPNVTFYNFTFNVMKCDRLS